VGAFQVETAGGAVRGADDHGVWVFKGVPYGADTGGEGRFRPPRAANPWVGVRDCLEYGPSCPQMTVEQMIGHSIGDEGQKMMGVLSAEPSTSEDCLVLNVWTPAVDATAKLPVLVWLHGGGWSTGSASWPLYYFDNLARHQQSVVVGINHRLGIMGFLDLSHLGEEFADSGNVGMLDVVAALEWMKANIAAFGGDAGRVTVFGESGGGLKTTALLGMPAGRGLFHNAIAMSGSMMAAQLPEQARETTEAVLEHLGVGAETEKLQALEVNRLVEAELALNRRGGLMMGGRSFSPVLGPSLPEHPELAIRAGLARDVTVVSGCTTDEVLSFLAADPELWQLTEQGLRDRLQLMLGDNTDAVLSAYKTMEPNESPTSLLIDILTANATVVPHIRLAEAKIEGGGAPAYFYQFAWGQPDPAGRVRAGHGSDMPYFFDNVDKAPIAAGPHAGPLVAAMSGAMGALSHNNDPNHESMPHWPRYTLDQRATMLFDVPSRVENDPFGAERRFWEGLSGSRL